MYISEMQDRTSKAKWGRKGLRTIYYPEDSAQALTTIHCRQTTAKSVRTTVIREHLPLEARREYMDKSFGIARSKRETTKRMDTERRRKFDYYYIGKGVWAVNAWVSLDDCNVIKCDYTTNSAPVISSPLRKYGSYKTYGTVFHSADVVIRYTDK